MSKMLTNYELKTIFSTIAIKLMMVEFIILKVLIHLERPIM